MSSRIDESSVTSSTRSAGSSESDWGGGLRRSASRRKSSIGLSGVIRNVESRDCAGAACAGSFRGADSSAVINRRAVRMRWMMAAALAITLAAPRQARAQADTGSFVMRDFRFASGETLPEVRIHYRTLGHPRTAPGGRVTNAVLILHGTGGSGQGFLSRTYAGELFNAGQPLDSARFYIIIPDNLGHGRSSKPSDGLHARFPHYAYEDMVTAQYRLLTE